MTESMPVSNRVYISLKSYFVGDILQFQHIKNGKTTGSCFAYEVAGVRRCKEGFEYLLE